LYYSVLPAFSTAQLSSLSNAGCFLSDNIHELPLTPSLLLVFPISLPGARCRYRTIFLQATKSSNCLPHRSSLHFNPEIRRERSARSIAAVQLAVVVSQSAFALRPGGRSLQRMVVFLAIVGMALENEVFGSVWVRINWLIREIRAWLLFTVCVYLTLSVSIYLPIYLFVCMFVCLYFC